MEEDELDEVEYVKNGPHVNTFPDDIDSNTDYLSLSKTTIKEIPPSIEKLTKLNFMKVVNGSLLRLPETIGNLVNLKNLNLSNNRLSSLPKTIGNLVNLNDLNLSNNMLSSLPETIKNLINLYYLDLSNNKLTYDIIPILKSLVSAIKINSREKPYIRYILNDNNIEMPVDHDKMDSKNNDDVVYVSITTHGSIPIDDTNNNKPLLFNVIDTLNSLEIQRVCALSAINLYPNESWE